MIYYELSPSPPDRTGMGLWSGTKATLGYSLFFLLVMIEVVYLCVPSFGLPAGSVLAGCIGGAVFYALHWLRESSENWGYKRG